MENSTPPDEGQKTSTGNEHSLVWFHEDAASDRAALEGVLTNGLGFPAAAFRALACDLAILEEALFAGDALDEQILRSAFAGITNRARAAAGLCEKEHPATPARAPARALARLEDADGALGAVLQLLAHNGDQDDGSGTVHTLAAKARIALLEALGDLKGGGS